MIEVCDKLTTILHETHYGDHLHQLDFMLVKSAANGHINDIGMGEIDTLYELIKSGKYEAKKRWLE